jgi:hypothetical protein
MINDLLQKLLKRKGVNEFSELTEEEKETYRKWDTILAGRKLTDNDVSLFLNTELEEVLQKLTNPLLSQREDVFLKMKLEFIRKIKLFLKTPEIEKNLIEQELKQL